VRDPVLSLAPSELRALATSVRSGRVSTPYSALSLQRIVGEHAAEPVARKLELLSASGMSSEALSLCLELTADALSSRTPLEDLVDLVTTGPETGSIANRSTAVVVGELFRGAKRSVLIAGYAVYQGQKVFQALGERMVQQPELDVRMFLDVPRKQGDTSSADVLIARFVQQFKSSQWPSGMPFPNLYCCEQLMTPNGKPGSLHAKCIVVDGDHVFVSSANFTEAAQQRNIEVGLLVQSHVVGERVCRFFETLLDHHYFLRAI
jgi:PLD-like domain